ncbi:MAG: AraC family transcriptional regulator ligand-binding domain-containing protein [Hyphomicrobiales bacterium]
MHIPLVRASAFAPFVNYLLDHDPNLAKAEAPVKLSPAIVEDPDALVPFEPAITMIAHYAEKLDQPDLGLRVGHALRVDSLGTYGMLLARTGTLADGLQTACTAFPAMNSGAHLTVEPDGAFVWLRHAVVGKDRPGSAQALQFTLVLLVDFVRMAAGREWMPSKALLPLLAQRQLPADSPYRAVTRVSPANEAAIAIDAALLHLPMNTPANLPDLGPRWDQFLANAPSKNFLRSLEQCLVPLMKSGQVSLEHVAAVSNFSVRTLQRRLDEEGVSFSEILDRTRTAEACRLLETTDLKVIEIAYELGYAEPASFTRAFTRWTGSSPARYRADRRQRAA